VIVKGFKRKWCHERDLNSRPPAYETIYFIFIFSIFFTLINLHKVIETYCLKALSVIQKNKNSKNSSISTTYLSLFYRQNTYNYCKLYCKLFLTFIISNNNIKKNQYKFNNFF